MNENDGGPAFPVQSPNGITGLSRRDLISTILLAGVLACPSEYANVKGRRGRINMVYAYADEMIEVSEAHSEKGRRT